MGALKRITSSLDMIHRVLTPNFQSRTQSVANVSVCGFSVGCIEVPLICAICTTLLFIVNNTGTHDKAISVLRIILLDDSARNITTHYNAAASSIASHFFQASTHYIIQSR